MMYKILSDLPDAGPRNMVLRVDDHSYIPFDSANTDYQEYLAWVAEGNEPLPAE